MTTGQQVGLEETFHLVLGQLLNNAPVSEEALEGVDKYWRVANYLSIGQIYLRSNPLMKEPFTREDVKHRLVGHWGTTPA